MIPADVHNTSERHDPLGLIPLGPHPNSRSLSDRDALIKLIEADDARVARLRERGG